MKDFVRDNLSFSLCGLNCGLCPMKLDGHCPGCGGGEGNQSCKIARCSILHGGIEYCNQCQEFPCEKYGRIDEYDIFITHRNWRQDFEKIKEMGVEAYNSEQSQKLEILKFLLKDYNDGRRKSFFCLAVNLLDLENLNTVVKHLKEEKKLESLTLKEKSAYAVKLLQSIAEQKGLVLKLNRKPKSRRKNMTTPKMETDRLILRGIQSDDVEEIFNCWMQDEEVSRYMFWKASNDIDDTKEFVEFELGNLENDKWNRWIIILKETSEIIGTCLIYFNEEENNWDISYNLGKRFWGRGYALEAMNKVMQYAKEVLKIKECIAVHAIENPASGHIIQKLGFHYEKDVPYECNGGDIVTTGRYYRFIV